MQIGRAKKNISPLPPGTKILMMLQLSYMPDQILRKKLKKPSNFKTKFDISLGSFPPKCRLGIAKIFFEKSPLVLELFRKKT